MFLQQETKLLQSLSKLIQSDDTIPICVKSPENVPHEGELLPHGFTDLLQHRAKLERSVAFTVNNFSCVMIMIENLKLMIEHLDVLPDLQVFGFENLARHLVQVHSLLEELSSDNTKVTLRWFMYGDR